MSAFACLQINVSLEVLLYTQILKLNIGLKIFWFSDLTVLALFIIHIKCVKKQNRPK